MNRGNQSNTQGYLAVSLNITELSTGNKFACSYTHNTCNSVSQTIPYGARHPHEAGKKAENKTKNRFLALYACKYIDHCKALRGYIT